MAKIKKLAKNHQLYKPINTEKYLGRQMPICRSTWEYSFCRYLDYNINVKKWDSESIVIQYVDPLNPMKKRRYFPDFYIEFINGRKWVVEIKPFKETIQPTNRGKKSNKTKIYENKTWKTNTNKWKAAEIYCKRMNYKFVILTEKDLF